MKPKTSIWMMRRAAALSGALLVVILSPLVSSTRASVIHVPGDAATVGQALTQAAAGDTVLIAGGGFGEPVSYLEVPAGVTLMGSGDWETRFAGFGLVLLDGPESSAVENIVFLNRGIVSDNPGARISRCRLGDRLYLWDDFVGVELDAGGTVENSLLYVRNWTATEWVLGAQSGHSVIRNNVVVGDVSYVLYAAGGDATESLTVRNNTFATPGSPFSLMYFETGSADVEVVNNIITPGNIICESSNPFIAHNCFPDGVLYEHLCVPADSNIVADPLFCGDLDAHGDELETYYLDASSPCIGAGENGTDIGALGVGCGATGIAGAAPPAPTRLRLAVSPNPVLEGAVFSFEPPPTGEALRLEIYDPLGRLAEVLRPAGPRLGWTPPPSAPRGVYFARLRGRGATEAVKFIVLR